MIRNVWLFRYPDGVSIEEGERWYLGTHTQEARKLPGLRKYRTYRVVNNPARPTRFVRLTEIWWDDMESWLKVEPYRAGFTRAPYLKPGADWIGSMVYEQVFVDENPEYDLLTQIPKLG